MLVRYDIRGIGLSEPVEPDFGLESHILDLQAVIDHLGLENFALLVPSTQALPQSPMQLAT
jgi:pimeloyl-ACP methyl ester carboxylesterase